MRRRSWKQGDQKEQERNPLFTQRYYNNCNPFILTAGPLLMAAARSLHDSAWTPHQCRYFRAPHSLTTSDTVPGTVQTCHPQKNTAMTWPCSRKIPASTSWRRWGEKRQLRREVSGRWISQHTFSGLRQHDTQYSYVLQQLVSSWQPRHECREVKLPCWQHPLSPSNSRRQVNPMKCKNK